MLSTPVPLTLGKLSRKDVHQEEKEKGMDESSGKAKGPVSSGPAAMAIASSATTASSPTMVLKGAGEAVAVNQAVVVVEKGKVAKAKEKGEKPRPGSSPQW